MASDKYKRYDRVIYKGSIGTVYKAKFPLGASAPQWYFVWLDQDWHHGLPTGPYAEIRERLSESRMP